MLGENLFVNAQGRRVCVECNGKPKSAQKPRKGGRDRATLYASRMRKVNQTDTCWLWQGCTNADGYGLVSVNIDGRQSTTVAHRWFYEYWNGPLPQHMSIDHTCNVRNCVRLEHLEAVTRSENMRRMHERRQK